MSNIVWSAESGWHDGPEVTVKLNSRGRLAPVCDWPRCVLMATHTVRRDVPRGDGFTSLIWHRCGGHTPIRASDRAGLTVTALGWAS